MQLALPAELPRLPEECTGIVQFRTLVLGLSQREVGEVARVQQAWISRIERGHLPRKNKWGPLLRAYGLSPEQFYMLVRKEAMLRAARKPMSETEPLLAMGVAETRAEVISHEEAQETARNGVVQLNARAG